MIIVILCIAILIKFLNVIEGSLQVCTVCYDVFVFLSISYKLRSDMTTVLLAVETRLHVLALKDIVKKYDIVYGLISRSQSILPTFILDSLFQSSK